MEKDIQFLDEFKPVNAWERLYKVGEFLAKHVRWLPAEAPAFMSEHYRPPAPAETGAEAMLFDEQGQIPEDLWG